jgi:hypothetical protein
MGPVVALGGRGFGEAQKTRVDVAVSREAASHVIGPSQWSVRQGDQTPR